MSHDTVIVLLHQYTMSTNVRDNFLYACHSLCFYKLDIKSGVCGESIFTVK